MESHTEASNRDTSNDCMETIQASLSNIHLENQASSPSCRNGADLRDGNGRSPVTLETDGKVSITVAGVIPDADSPKPRGRNIFDLPTEILELICRQYLDICSNTCLGLTCKAFFNITEHLHPFQVSLFMRTLPSRKCLGHLLTEWMAPKYTFDHSWGKFLPKRQFVKNEDEIDRKWREKEAWPKIRLQMDKMGATVAYKSKRKGF